jgi:hypothetical protein
MKMKINTLKKAEELVCDNPILSWDGWDINYIYEDSSGFLKKEGIYKDNKWHIKEVYKYINGGWNIPDERIK